MAKKRQKQLGGMCERNQSSSENDMDEDSSWVIVKKQRITILIPAPPVTERSTTSEPGASQEVPGDTLTKQPATPLKACPPATSPVNHKKLKPSASKSNHCFTTKVPSPEVPTLPTSLEGNLPMLPQNLEELEPKRSNKSLRSSAMLKSQMRVHVLNATCSLSNGATPLDQKLRMQNLSQKLDEAGGLSSWLMSLGLDQLAGVLQNKRVNKFQLANLTMEKLKDMGAAAVGPRRKLLHAIDCVYHPYCLKAP